MIYKLDRKTSYKTEKKIIKIGIFIYIILIIIILIII